MGLPAASLSEVATLRARSAAGTKRGSLCRWLLWLALSESSPAPLVGGQGCGLVRCRCRWPSNTWLAVLKRHVPVAPLSSVTECVCCLHCGRRIPFKEGVKGVLPATRGKFPPVGAWSLRIRAAMGLPAASLSEVATLRARSAAGTKRGSLCRWLLWLALSESSPAPLVGGQGCGLVRCRCRWRISLCACGWLSPAASLPARTE